MNKHVIGLFITLAALWLLNSGIYNGLLLSLGFVSVCFAVWMAARMGIIDRESQPLHISGKLPGYYLWLVKKIIQSNIDVVIRIWRGSSSISPCTARLPCKLDCEVNRVIYANSITLTPGTVTMDLKEDSVFVHSLTTAGIEELQQGEMMSRVDRLDLE